MRFNHIRLKSARRSQIRRLLHVNPHRGENPPQGRGCTRPPAGAHPRAQVLEISESGRASGTHVSAPAFQPRTARCTRQSPATVLVPLLKILVLALQSSAVPARTRGTWRAIFSRSLSDGRGDGARWRGGEAAPKTATSHRTPVRPRTTHQPCTATHPHGDHMAQGTDKCALWSSKRRQRQRQIDEMMGFSYSRTGLRHMLAFMSFSYVQL